MIFFIKNSGEDMDKTDEFTFGSVLEISTNKLWGAHFGVPQWIADALIAAREDKRVVCVLNNVEVYQCAMLPRGNGSFLISVNKKIRDKYGLKEGSKLQIALRPDDSEYGLPMPEEMAELLKQDDEGNRLFHALTPGKLRTLLYIIGQPKSSDARLLRALVIVEHLKSTGGKIDYRKLNEDLKNRKHL